MVSKDDSKTQPERKSHSSLSQSLKLEVGSQAVETDGAEPAQATEAAEKVLGICELLDWVLLSCHPRDLHNYQRVSTFWRDIISTSKRLQKAMWLSDATAHLTPTCTTYGNDLVCTYKSSEIVFNPCFTVGSQDYFGGRPYNFNAFPCYALRWQLAWRMHPSEDLYFVSQQLQTLYLANRSPNVASWRKMLLTSPPVRAVDVVAGHDTPFWHGLPSSRYTRMLFNPNGITFGDLYDGIEGGVLGLPDGTEFSYRFHLQGSLAEQHGLLTDGTNPRQQEEEEEEEEGEGEEEEEEEDEDEEPGRDEVEEEEGEENGEEEDEDEIVPMWIV
ncbi:hypothetical protein CBER1_06224 [Cercospora berteroae]|uniref:F-box domain-containing protein n=1 Tax=Cercospora berteroae TaxID=357750 RepID=A0A2S6CMF9_9PEZI|nr:hypothetical protein CBER1_06224 [Cercospora berteroae]